MSLYKCYLNLVNSFVINSVLSVLSVINHCVLPISDFVSCYSMLAGVVNYVGIMSIDTNVVFV